MNVFYSIELGRINGYITNLQNERRNLAETFGPTDFFAPRTKQSKVPGEPGYMLLYQQLNALLTQEMSDKFVIARIQLIETKDWQLFEYGSFERGANQLYNTIDRYVVHIHDDLMALQYKLTYK
jgi:hypothetical protein